MAWVKEKVVAGHVVRTVFECCGFGYTLHEQLTAAGAQALLAADTSFFLRAFSS